MATYPPPQQHSQPWGSGWNNNPQQASLVEETRRLRIRAVKRQGFIYGGLEVAFTAVFAVLLGIYIKRARDKYDSRYDDNWYRWYIWLLVALLVLNALFAAYTIFSVIRTLKWLKNPATPPELILSGASPGNEYRSNAFTLFHTPAQQWGSQNNAPPPPMYAPHGGNNNGEYDAKDGGQYPQPPNAYYPPAQDGQYPPPPGAYPPYQEGQSAGGQYTAPDPNRKH
ncbi:hypothetical protein GGF46_000273 [Coemansia sp. RSA 552]|nr:hypothetical protein GGF46_000273 [Coemansia sp. RSA 552]